jgi:hypothetical protein
MYDSPIRLAVSKMTSQFNDDIYNAVVKTGIDVDKDELVRALNYDRNQYEKGYRDGLKASKWISVKERLPEAGERVLATDGYFVGEFFLNRRGQWLRYNISDCLLVASLDILHWMPLPEPPKEEGE